MRAGIPLTTAREQLQRTPPEYVHVGVQPLPAGQPGRKSLKDFGVLEPSPLTIFVVGDTGGIKNAAPSYAVSNAMQQDPARPAFAWHVGDVVYFNGDADQYGPQFYEAYAHLAIPIFAHPGNHDGDTTDDPSRKPLDTFMANFCAATAAVPVADPENEFGRDTMTQPWCDWTLQADAVTMIALYSNVPSGGYLYPQQTSWLISELQAAPTDRPLVVSLHHPPYSIDAHHGGSAKMGRALDESFAAANRWPDLVLAGHVHDYQRFTRKRPGGTTTYIVIGNGGYHNLHKLAPGATPGQPIDGADPAVTYEAGDDQDWGYLALQFEGTKISGAYTGVRAVDDAGTAETWPGKDSFTVEVA